MRSVVLLTTILCGSAWGRTYTISTIAGWPPIQVWIGGQPAVYTYAGEAPGMVAGVMQLNVRVPANVSPGTAFVVVSIGGKKSQGDTRWNAPYFAVAGRASALRLEPGKGLARWYNRRAMRAIDILGKSQTIKIGKEPVVLVPLSLWRKAEDFLEDQEALASRPYLRRIRKARADVAAGKVLFPFE